MKTEFKIGSVLVFEPKNLNQDYWNRLTEEEKINYYGQYGYGHKKTKHFIFMCPVIDSNGDTGHSILWDMEEQKIIQMAHNYEFRMATEEEF
jgi:hypothetical protein